jgi:hypothetical protein
MLLNASRHLVSPRDTKTLGKRRDRPIVRTESRPAVDPLNTDAHGLHESPVACRGPQPVDSGDDHTDAATEQVAEQAISRSPLTDSNRRPPPYHFRGGTGVHSRASAITFFLQIGNLRCVCRALACPRVPKLMYPSRTRSVLSVLKTHNEEGPVWVSTAAQRIWRWSRLLGGRASVSKSPVSYASTTAWTRSRRLSFWSMCVMCVLTVVSLM